MFVFLLCCLGFVVLILINVAYITYLERSILSVSQIRVSPNKVSLSGIAQPLVDGIKLLVNEGTAPEGSNRFLFFLSPGIVFVIMMLMWLITPHIGDSLSFGFSLVFLLCCVGLNVYSSLLAGMTSTSNYSVIGGLRAVSQTISYEVVLAFVVMSVFFWRKSYMVVEGEHNMFYCLCLGLWIISLLAETMRAPFDFSEGESELVSGFNTEYSSTGFVFLFLGEYGSIAFFSSFTSVMFFGNSLVGAVATLWLILELRACLPRFRYDFLINLCWFVLLPTSVNLFVFSVLMFS